MSIDLIVQRLTRGSGFLAILLIGAVAPGFGAHVPRSGAQDKQEHREHSASKASLADAREGHATLWKDPAVIEGLDLFYGKGGPEGAPDASAKFTFVRRSSSGTSKKIIVKDDKDKEWTVKFGSEARPETAATRIVWAMGYHVDEDYFVKRAHIEGWPEGDAVNVRFERSHNGYKEIGLWNWESNSFKGTRELDGLKILMVLMNNWDLKNDNNKVLRYAKDSDGDANERIYYVSDLGAFVWFDRIASPEAAGLLRCSGRDQKRSFGLRSSVFHRRRSQRGGSIPLQGKRPGRIEGNYRRECQVDGQHARAAFGETAWRRIPSGWI